MIKPAALARGACKCAVGATACKTILMLKARVLLPHSGPWERKERTQHKQTQTPLQFRLNHQGQVSLDMCIFGGFFLKMYTKVQ